MPIYRTALCEDEKAVRDELAAECRDIFAAWGVAATVDAFGSADALASELAGGKEWDLYLLDIQMEGTDGLAFARTGWYLYPAAPNTPSPDTARIRCTTCSSR